MKAWLASNWWWMLPGGVALSYFSYKVHRRGGKELLPRRVLYAFVPMFDPESEQRRRLSPRVAAAVEIVYALFFLWIAAYLLWSNI
jgi:hypothetical protein